MSMNKAIIVVVYDEGWMADHQTSLMTELGWLSDSEVSIESVFLVDEV
jgi:hypothetical protein